MFDKAQLLLTRVDDCWALFISARASIYWLVETKVSTGFRLRMNIVGTYMKVINLPYNHKPKSIGLGAI